MEELEFLEALDFLVFLVSLESLVTKKPSGIPEGFFVCCC